MTPVVSKGSLGKPLRDATDSCCRQFALVGVCVRKCFVCVVTLKTFRDAHVRHKRNRHHIHHNPSKEVSQTSRGYGLGCGTSARPPLGQNRKDILAPRKLEVKGWVSEC